MGGRARADRVRARGGIDELPSGAVRVRVYTGTDPLTRRRVYRTAVIAPGPRAWEEAEATRARFVQEAAERRTPRTNATLDELLSRYLDQLGGSPGTRDLYRGHVRNHIGPCLGYLRVGQLDAEVGVMVGTRPTSASNTSGNWRLPYTKSFGSATPDSGASRPENLEFGWGEGHSVRGTDHLLGCDRIATVGEGHEPVHAGRVGVEVGAAGGGPSRGR